MGPAWFSKVLRMSPDIQTHVKKHPVYEKGELVRFAR